MAELYFFLAGFFIACSMLFTSSEASIFSLSRLELASLKSFHLSEKYLKLLRSPEELLVVLIAGNELVDYFASFCFARGFGEVFKTYGKEIAFFIFGITGFWLGEFFPKVVGFKYNTKLAPRVFPIILIFYYIFFPLRKLFSLIYKTTEAYLKKKEQKTKEGELFSPVEQIILEAIEVAYREKKISEKEKTFIYGLFLSEKVPVSTAMVPRSEVVALEDQPITQELLEKLKNLPYHQFPVYKGELDNVLGIFYVKEFIKKFSPEVLGKAYLSQFTKEAFFVNENFKLRDLLFEFQKRHVKLALVVDEYGVFKWLITLEDVLEELFGEFYHEKEPEIEEIKEVDKGRWIVHGKVLLEELAHEIGLEVEEELKEARTLNGFLLALFKELPEEGDSIEYKGFRFTIKQKKKRKIIWVEVESLKND